MLIATQHTGEQRWRCRESCVPKQKRVYIAYSASVETVSNEMKNFIYGKYGLLLVSIYIVLLVCGNWQQRRSVYESDIRKVKWAVTAKKNIRAHKHTGAPWCKRTPHMSMKCVISATTDQQKPRQIFLSQYDDITYTYAIRHIRMGSIFNFIHI